jgi:hypothetical protein
MLISRSFVRARVVSLSSFAFCSQNQHHSRFLAVFPNGFLGGARPWDGMFLPALLGDDARNALLASCGASLPFLATFSGLLRALSSRCPGFSFPFFFPAHDEGPHRLRTSLLARKKHP